MNAAKKKACRAVRFHNETHGPELLAAVREFQRMTGLAIKDRNFWPKFKDWAAKHEALKMWDAPPATWRSRHLLALRTSTPEAQAQVDQADQMKAAIRSSGMGMEEAYSLIAQQLKISCSQVKRQFWGAEPWSDDVADAVTKLVGKDPRKVGAPTPADPCAKQQELPVLPWKPVERADSKVPGQTKKSLWDLNGALEVLDNLEKLVRAGKDVCNKDLNFYLEHARVKASIEDLTSALLRETSNK